MALIKKQYKRQRKSRKQQKRLKKRKQQKRKTKKRGKYVRKGGAAVDQINNDKPLSVVEMLNKATENGFPPTPPNIETFNYTFEYNTLDSQDLTYLTEVDPPNNFEKGNSYLIKHRVRGGARVSSGLRESVKIMRYIGVYTIPNTDSHAYFNGFRSDKTTFHLPNKEPVYSTPIRAHHIRMGGLDEKRVILEAYKVLDPNAFEEYRNPPLMPLP